MGKNHASQYANFGSLRYFHVSYNVMLCFGLLCVLSSILLSITNNVGIFAIIYKSYLIIEYMKLPQICRQP